MKLNTGPMKYIFATPCLATGTDPLAKTAMASTMVACGAQTRMGAFSFDDFTPLILIV
eukprot:03393.XXX_6732_6905_1 [CDS] Oithona nana genome sequencing.